LPSYSYEDDVVHIDEKAHEVWMWMDNHDIIDVSESHITWKMISNGHYLKALNYEEAKDFIEENFTPQGEIKVLWDQH
jgi:hypothetical protein